MFNPQKVVWDKFVDFVPPALILIPVLLAHFRGSWFFVAAIVSAAVILFLFFRALPAPPAASRVRLILPFVFLIGVFGTAAASPLAGTFFAVLGSYLIYYYYRFFPKAVPVFVEQTVGLYAAFLFAVFLWSLNYFFTLPWWIMVSLAGAGFLVLFWQAFYKMSESPAPALGTMVGTLVMAEIFWAMLFWPVHFFTSAVVSFAVFYLVYMLSSLHFARRLSRRKIYFQVSFISVVVLITLLSSSWQPIGRV